MPLTLTEIQTALKNLCDTTLRHKAFIIIRDTGHISLSVDNKASHNTEFFKSAKDESELLSAIALARAAITKHSPGEIEYANWQTLQAQQEPQPWCKSIRPGCDWPDCPCEPLAEAVE